MTPRLEDDGDPILGTTISGKYQVLAPIAKGGMGRIYRALQMPLEREVAIKVLDVAELRRMTGREDAGEDFQRRFFLEAASAAQLSHPNTVVIHDYGHAGPDAYFIAMEYLAGQTFAELIDAEAPLPPERVVHVALQICASLSEAHACGLVHRDLKPSNVILTRRGSDPDYVKVVDFGLVKRQDTDVTLTQSGALVGTPRYMSPEQISCQPVGPATDIYSLGAVMYHALTGRPPFDSESKFVLMAAHVNVEPPPIAEVAPQASVPAALEAVVRRCLEKDPAARYGSMAELSDALIGCGFSSGGVSSGTRLAERGAHAPVNPAVGSDPTLVARAARKPPPAGPTRAARGARWVGGGLAVGGLVALSMLFLRTGPTAPAAPPGAPPPAPAAHQPPAEAPPPTPERPPGEVEVHLGEPPGGAAPDAPIHRVRVETHPPGAWVRHGQTDLGDSPVTLLLREGAQWTIEVGAAGYVPRRVTVTAGQETALIRLRRRGAPATAPVEPPPEPTVMSTDNRNPWASPSR